jgi:hypothetical protein
MLRKRIPHKGIFNGWGVASAKSNNFLALHGVFEHASVVKPRLAVPRIIDGVRVGKIEPSIARRESLLFAERLIIIMSFERWLLSREIIAGHLRPAGRGLIAMAPVTYMPVSGWAERISSAHFTEGARGGGVKARGEPEVPFGEVAEAAP